ncbi:MAG: CYTH domain-containing protein, partial [Candidatus Limnocylindrales bacterium]
MTGIAEDAPAGHPVEVELKYRVTDPSTGERLITTDALGAMAATVGRLRTVHIEDHYVDTAAGTLAHAGFAVRLRQNGADTIVSVKSLARTDAAGGAVRREELEGPADRLAPALDWPESDARLLVIEHAGAEPLLERATIRQVRRKRILKAGLTRIELSLDAVDVTARGRIVGSFIELEAELVKGDEAILAEVAQVFDAEPGLVRSTGSKLDAALAAVEGTGDHSGDLSTDDAGRDPALAGIARAPEPVPELPAAEPAPPPRLSVGKTPGVVADD